MTMDIQVTQADYNNELHRQHIPRPVAPCSGKSH